MPALTDKQIDELLELYEKTDQGIWSIENGYAWTGSDYVFDPQELEGDTVEQAQRHEAFAVAAHNAFPALHATLAEKDARAKRFALETCSLDHDYAFEVGKDKPRCPFCLVQGLELARADLQQANERVVELESALIKIAEWSVNDGHKSVKNLHQLAVAVLAQKKRSHTNYCGLADDHEGDCVAVVTRMLGV